MVIACGEVKLLRDFNFLCDTPVSEKVHASETTSQRGTV